MARFVLLVLVLLAVWLGVLVVVCWFYVCVFGLCSYETVCCLGLNCFVSLAYGGFLCGWLAVVAVFALRCVMVSLIVSMVWFVSG